MISYSISDIPIVTHILAEERRQIKCHRKNDDQNKQHRILQIAEKLINSKFVFLVKRDLVDKILQKAKRTQKSAHCPAEHGSEKDQKTEHIVRELELDPS